MDTCAKALPPNLYFPFEISTKIIVVSVLLKSGVITLLISGQHTYADITNVLGDLIFLLPFLLLIDKLSFPPSIDTPSSIKNSDNFETASYNKYLSLHPLKGHIQLPEHLISSNPDTLAQTKLVSISPTVILTIASILVNPFNGCSPIALAIPVVLKCDWATTATSAKGICRGPTHCC